MHFGVPSASTTQPMEESWDAKFKWSAVSDYFSLYRVMLKFLDDLKQIDRDL